MLVCSRVGQVFLIGDRKKVPYHYLVTGIQPHEDAWDAWHEVVMLETGDTLRLTESYLARAEGWGWRER